MRPISTVTLTTTVTGDRIAYGMIFIFMTTPPSGSIAPLAVGISAVVTGGGTTAGMHHVGGIRCTGGKKSQHTDAL